MSEGIPTGNTAPGLTAVVVIFIIWSTLTYAARCWVKLRRSDGWNVDDTVISLAFVVVIFHLVAVSEAVKHGYGNPWHSLSDYDKWCIEVTLYASQILYIIALGLTKISAGFFNARMTRDSWHIRLTQALIGLSGIWAVTSVLVIAVRGNLAAPWMADGDGSLWIRWLCVEVIGLALEVAFWASSIYGVVVLHMSMSKKVSISAIFSVRLAIIPLIVLRLIYLSPQYSTNLPIPSITVSIYTEIAMQLTFLLASAIRLKPFLKPFHPGYFVHQAPNQRSSIFASGNKEERGDAYYMLSGAGSRTRTPFERESDPHTMGPRLAVPTPTFSPVESYYKATISAHESSRRNSIVKTDQNTIAVKETWSLTVEENGGTEGGKAQRNTETNATTQPINNDDDDEIQMIPLQQIEEHGEESDDKSGKDSHV